MRLQELGDHPQVLKITGEKDKMAITIQNGGGKCIRVLWRSS